MPSNEDTSGASTTVLRHLGIGQGDALPEDAVAKLVALARCTEGTLRTAVLDRRLGGDSWPEIAKDLGVTAQAARQRFFSPTAPARPARLRVYPDVDAFYAARPHLAEAWGYRPGTSATGAAPHGSDEGGLRTDDGYWMVTLSAPPATLKFDMYRRVGAPAAHEPCDVVATRSRDGEVTVLATDVPLAAAARALATLPGSATPQQCADAIAGEVERIDALRPINQETDMASTPYGPALAKFASKADFYAAYPGAAEGWEWKTHPGTAPLGSDLFNDRSGYLVIVCHPGTGLGASSLQEGRGPVVAFEHATGTIYVLDESMTFSEARKCFRQAS